MPAQATDSQSDFTFVICSCAVHADLVSQESPATSPRGSKRGPGGKPPLHPHSPLPGMLQPLSPRTNNANAAKLSPAASSGIGNQSKQATAMMHFLSHAQLLWG